ncbi:DUF2236 domain-containing protein [Nocardioides sp. W3-2-3]|uniref:oxygenase MpaB family protein n=1 Tax=Nocardioides convexus TaxID=2712224 RepID=UPI002418B321|nr:oxygenase MpaB family protein [Nocardioides convexus]NHA00906.1 DUF2236 domain-containing protein [Nocardioides convexus]
MSVRDRLGQAIFHRVAGPDGARHRDRIHGRPGPRWFAPDSAIVRVHGDASMFVGGIRALLLQSLHPAAMRAVSEHSGYRGDMWGRLARTSRFLAVTTFGTAEDAQQAVDAVRAIHDRISGTMPDGSSYAASDPHLLRWVHVAEVDRLPARPPALRRRASRRRRPRRVRRPDRRGRPPPRRRRPAGHRGGAWPPSSRATGPSLRGTPEAREAVTYVLLRPPLPLLARPAYGVLAAAAVGLMPTWTRLPLRLPWLPVTERTVVRVLGGAAVDTVRWAMTPPPARAAT